MAGVCSSALATDSLLCEMKNSLRSAAFCAGVVAGVAWLTSSGMSCFVAVVRCFMRRCREVEEAVELFTKSDLARRRRVVTRFLWAANVYQASGERE